jgi:hypothetical protein
MKNEHLTDLEIQKYLFNDSVEREASDHLKHCVKCRLIAEDYKSLAEAVRTQDKPAFGPEMADMVMNSLQIRKPDFSFSKLLISVMAAIFIPVTLILVFLFRTGLSSVLKGISPLLIYLIVTTVICLSIVQFLDSYIHYRKHMDILNSY